jgi:hypothetical protein
VPRWKSPPLRHSVVFLHRHFENESHCCAQCMLHPHRSEAIMTRIRRGLLAALALSITNSGCGGSPPAPRYPGDADFVFTGTVVQPRASTIGADDVTDLAIVRVDQILFGGPVFAELAGSTVTVKLRNAADARTGQQRMYFANGWHWGEGVGVVEVSSVNAPEQSQLPAVRTAIEASRQEHTDQQIRDRLRVAEQVVAGRVTAVRPSSIPRTPTEHDPEWREADIAVTTVLKGNPETRTLTILFPGTDDPMWFRAPRFTVGQEGIWLLHRFVMGRRTLPNLTAPQPEDFRPRGEEERIRRLLRQ